LAEIAAMNSTVIAILLGVAFMTSAADSIQVEPGKQLPQKVTVHVDGDGAKRDVTIRYMLFVPRDYKADGKKWPLMLFLHGLGESSNDDLSRVKIHGPAKLVEKQPDFPFVLVTPQLPPPVAYDPNRKKPSDGVIAIVRKAWKAEELIKLVDHVATELNVDPERIYVTGLSMGGFGTWRLVSTYPDRFAAAVCVCGGGEPETMARNLSKVPIWAFHGAKDPVVPLSESEKMVDAVKRAGGDVKLTVYADVEHNSWDATYSNPKVFDWLLEHKRKQSK
jgi:predicted peptidase